MAESALGLALIMLLSGALCVVLLSLAVFIGPKRHSKIKDDPFECGTIGTGDANQRFSVKFYLVAVIFILFDIEIVFMYPWAVSLREVGWTAFWGMMPFLSIVELGLFYIWKRGVLDWV